MTNNIKHFNTVFIFNSDIYTSLCVQVILWYWHFVWLTLQPHLISHCVWVTPELSLIMSFCLGHTTATSDYQSFWMDHTRHNSFLKMSCTAKYLAIVLRKFQYYAGMSFLHIQILGRKRSQPVCSCSVLYHLHSQSTLISLHLISIWSCQIAGTCIIC